MRRNIWAAIIALAIFSSALPPSHVFAAAGDLDPAFGIKGISFHDDVEYIYMWLPTGTLVQPDGKILTVMGDSWVGSTGLTRSNSVGLRDSTFGRDGDMAFSESGYSGFDIEADGKILYAERGEVRRHDSNGIFEANVLTHPSAYFEDLAVQRDGKFVTVGTNSGQSVLRRFYPDGSPDPLFGTNGTVTLPKNLFLEVSLQPDGSFILRGHIYLSPLARYVRVTSDGSIDRSWGVNGVLDVLGRVFENSGKIYLVNRLDAPDRIQVHRLRSDGSIDSSFGENGAAVMPVGDYTFGRLPDLVFDSHGRILVPFSTVGRHFGIARLNPSGTFDETFGSAGVVEIPVGAAGEASSVKILSNGKILVVGAAGSNANLVLVRLQGESVTTGMSGRVTAPSGRAVIGARVTVQNSDGTLRATLTSSLGYFTFTDLPIGTYSVSVSSKRYRFTSTKVQLQSSVEDLNFVAQE